MRTNAELELRSGTILGKGWKILYLSGTIKKFRPISLCNASYKIFSKVLSMRLKSIIQSLISPNQGGFISSRKISDNILMVQEVTHSSSKRGEPGMAIKMDLANAFDRLRHSFILLVLKKFGFPPIFINQVQSCIKSPWIAPLINGRPSEFFKASRGIRQGCQTSIRRISPRYFL